LLILGVVGDIGPECLVVGWSCIRSVVLRSSWGPAKASVVWVFMVFENQADCVGYQE
jgi:hypothetical protein